jgi:hypothetical protein
MKKLSAGLREDPIYTVESEINQYIYEAGFQSKNLFTELSILRTSMLEKLTPELKEKFGFTDSAKITIYVGSKPEKTILIGKKTFDQRFNYITDQDYVFKILSPIVERFEKTEPFFRENRLFQTHGELLLSITYNYKKNNYHIKNKIENLEGKEIDRWYIQPSEKLIPAKKSNNLTGLLNSINIYKHPEDIGPDGFSIASDITKVHSASLEISIRGGKKYLIYFYPPLSFQSESLIPIKKTINDNLAESVSFIKQSDFEKIQKYFNVAISSTEKPID